MFPPVQPYRLQLIQSRANGGGAHAAFRQVGANAGDQVCARVGAVNGAAGVDHDAVPVGQDGEVTRVDDGTPQFFENRLGGFNQLLVGFLGALHLLVRHGVKNSRCLGRQPQAKAALP